VPLALKVGCSSGGVGCDIALLFIVLYVGLMAIFLWCYVFLRFLSIGVIAVPSGAQKRTPSGARSQKTIIFN
jgi:hypothetical protein